MKIAFSIKEIKREKLTGLKNLGAQLFSNLKELRDYLYNKEYTLKTCVICDIFLEFKIILIIIYL